MKRTPKPTLSADAHATILTYAHMVETEQDVSPATYRNYISDLHQFAAWCEAIWSTAQETGQCFQPAALTTPLITRYLAFLQHTQQLKPASINRALVSIKRYTAWAVGIGLLTRDPARSVKLIPIGPTAPRHLSDTEEEALLAAVTATGSMRDQTIITLMLHTGLRAQEVCTVQRSNITLGKRSGLLRVYGKRNKYREVPLNSTARTALAIYLAAYPGAESLLFMSGKTG